MIALTSGFKFADIDTIASCFATKELLKLQQIDSKIILPKDISPSVTKEMFSWFDKNEIVPLEDYKYPEEEIYVFDISEIAFLSKNLPLNKVKKLYDHHYGYEKDWENINVEVLKIEPVGATATQIFELFQEKGLESKMSKNIANLLFVTIITHTLNLKSLVTTERDISAVKSLRNFISIDDAWIEKYYKDLEIEVIKNITDSIKNDTKFSNIKGVEIAFGQLELWDSREILSKYRVEITKALESSNKEEWLFSSPSISEGVNYIFTNSDRLKKILEEELNMFERNDYIMSEKLLLRKEILRVIQ